MSVVGTVRQQPADVQDYDIDFSEWFPVDDQIVSAGISVTPPMPLPPSYAISPSGQVIKVWVYEGGTSGTTYQVSLKATTNDGRVKEVELRVRIKEV